MTAGARHPAPHIVDPPLAHTHHHPPHPLRALSHITLPSPPFLHTHHPHPRHSPPPPLLIPYPLPFPTTSLPHPLPSHRHPLPTLFYSHSSLIPSYHHRHPYPLSFQATPLSPPITTVTPYPPAPSPLQHPSQPYRSACTHTHAQRRAYLSASGAWARVWSAAGMFPQRVHGQVRLPRASDVASVHVCVCVCICVMHLCMCMCVHVCTYAGAGAYACGRVEALLEGTARRNKAMGAGRMGWRSTGSWKDYQQE